MFKCKFCLASWGQWTAWLLSSSKRSLYKNSYIECPVCGVLYIEFASGGIVTKSPFSNALHFVKDFCLPFDVLMDERAHDGR